MLRLKRGIQRFRFAPFLDPHPLHPSLLSPFFLEFWAEKYSSYFPFLKSFDRVISHGSFFVELYMKVSGAFMSGCAFFSENEGSSLLERAGDLITITSSLSLFY